jgi:hypothetical protein
VEAGERPGGPVVFRQLGDGAIDRVAGHEVPAADERIAWIVKSVLYKWIDRRNSIPFWVRWFFPKVHWCPEMDELLILDNTMDCFCGYVDRASLLCPLCGDHDIGSECHGDRL